MTKQERKFKQGDLVIYAGLIGRVDYVTFTASGNLPMLGLTSIEDEEMTCTAMESECEAYSDEMEIDQSEALFEAKLSSKRIQNMVGGLTDKYFRDGCH